MTIRTAVFLASSCFLAACAAPVVEKVLPVASGSPTAGAESKNYELSPDDMVTISVFQEPDMTTSQQIARDGSISFPLVGRVVIGGLTLGEAEAEISKGLTQKYLVNPQVSIAVTQYAAQTYTILGQVAAPGVHPIPYGKNDFTLPMAIAGAGGNTRIGNLHNVRVNRRKGDQTLQYTVNMPTVEGQQFIIQGEDLITVQETLF